MPLSAQSLSWGNTTDYAITPNFVSGDYWTLQITGATPNAAIVLQYTFNGGPTEYYTLASTDSSGNYNTSEQETNSNLGQWTAIWLVGAVQLGPEYDFEVIRLPDKIAVVTQGPYAPCGGSEPYGLIGTVDFTLQDADGEDVERHNIMLNAWD